MTRRLFDVVVIDRETNTCEVKRAGIRLHLARAFCRGYNDHPDQVRRAVVVPCVTKSVTSDPQKPTITE